jgi:4-hydroxythreonine-4-phosphate dehydrogenase
MKKLKFKKKINILNLKKIDNINISNNDINLIDINYKTKKAFEKISTKSNKYIQNSFEVALNLINKNFSNKLINGPVSKKSFLNNKFLGITEYLAKKSNVKDIAMLIYNDNLSVSPVTTHLPLKKVAKKIDKKLKKKKIILINFNIYIRVNRIILILVLILNFNFTSMSV